MKNLLNLKIPKSVIIGLVIAAVLITVTAVAVKMTPKEEQNTATYYYNATEQRLADKVTDYLSSYIELKKNVIAEIANVAVENYRIILKSDVDMVNDEHTDAIQKRIRVVIEDSGSETAVLSAQDKDEISGDIAQIVWDTILSQIETTAQNVDLEDEYSFLVESIQGQIDRLEERKMKVSIQANINGGEEMTADELLTMVEGMSDRELEELARAMGFSYEELYALINSAGKDSMKELENRLETLKKEIISELKKELTRELSGSGGTNGRDGRDGRNGQDGKDGETGKTGKDGTNGKTTYIAYADDASGNNFSLTPLETSKYIGTCITTAKTQPTDRASYGNWQTYRSHVITETTENGVTTVHIN